MPLTLEPTSFKLHLTVAEMNMLVASVSSFRAELERTADRNDPEHARQLVEMDQLFARLRSLVEPIVLPQAPG